MLDQIGVVCSLLILSAMSIIVNSFCIYIIKKTTSFHKKPSSIFVVSLLIIHLFQAVFVFPLYAAKKMKVKNFYWAQFFSNGFLFTYLLSYYGVCFGVLNISLDRFLATYLLMKYKIYINFKNTLIVILMTWLYITLLCLIPFIPKSAKHKSITADGNYTGDSSLTNMSTSYNINIQPKTTSSSRLNISSYSETFKGNHTISMASPETKDKTKGQFYYYVPQNEWTVFMLFFNAALPLGIIILCYMYVIYRLIELNKSQRQRKESTATFISTSGKIKARELNRYTQATRLTMVLTATYSILWSPSIIYYTILSVCEVGCFVDNWDNSSTEKHIVYIIKYLSFLNSLFSPLVYCFHHSELRTKFCIMQKQYVSNQSSITETNENRHSIHNIEMTNLVESNHGM